MTPAEQYRARDVCEIDLGFVGRRSAAASEFLKWQRHARQITEVAIPVKHPLAQQGRVSLAELKGMFFVGMSEESHPGFRDWLAQICQPAGFTPRILQDAELEPGLMRFVAEGLGVTLAREQIKNIPHPGVAFRPIAPPVKADYWIAWKRDNASKALRDYVQIVKTIAGSSG